MPENLLAPLIPIFAILAFAGVKIARIWAQAQHQGQDPQTPARLAALEDDVALLRQQLDETQERLDFTERLLSQQRRERLEPPA